MKSDLESLSKEQMLNIYQLLLKEDTITITENDNGIFFDLSSFPKNIIKKLEEQIEYSKKTDESLKMIEERNNDLKTTIVN